MLKPINHQSGVSLIEVLITTLILGVGLLGVAALQVTSLTSNQSGFYRGQASAIADDVASRVKAAKFAFYDGNTDVSQIISGYTGAPYACGDAPASNCDGSDCSSAQMAVFDQWQTCNSASLQLPDGEVFVVSGGGDKVQIAVAWTPVASRPDFGEGAASEFINLACAPLGVAAEKDCVILEVVP